MEFNRFLTLHFNHIHMEGLLLLYISLHRKCFFLMFWKLYWHIALLKLDLSGKGSDINGNTNDKTRGIQLSGPDYLQKVLKEVN